MGIVHGKYKQLKPEFHYMCDEVVLAQAWKKSHAFIRAHNWYADTLDLDCSAVNLENRIKEWSAKLRDHSYTPSEMKMIPAPKSDHWTFYKVGEDWKWGPKPKDEVSDCKELRPLAHLNIQDQTVSTAIMLCLADAVETEQGCTESDQVWSYGNRLFCDWNGKTARFRWGNSNTYSKYFQDYQRFLERPIKKAQEIQAGLPPTAGIYEIHLDLSAFYDSIDRKQLVRKLKIIASKHYEVELKQWELFWEVVENIFQGWQWAEDDTELAACLKNGTLSNGQGVPQGLVASGFFANAYLINLDSRLCKKIGNQFGDVTLIDYCRYVDDIRLLVHVPVALEPEWEDWVETNIQPLVMRTKGMQLNSEKTKVERYTAKRSGVSVRMKAIQKSASGPQDITALDEMQGSLEGLLAVAEQFRDQRDLPHRYCDIPLAKVDQPQMDVREDTLLRFAANRLTKALSEKRLFAADYRNGNESVSELDHIYESFARRFVAVWTRNPSLVAILKKGIQLYPHHQLLQPVFDALFKKLGPTNHDPNHIHKHERERLIAFYCLAELFRFAALVLHRQKPEDRPQHSDWEGLNNFLICKSRELVAEYDPPWYVEQQIALFMAVKEETIKLPDLKELEDSRLLLRILQGDRRFGKTNTLEKRVPLFVIAFQVSSRPQQVVATLSDWIEWLYGQKERRLAAGVIREVAINHPALFELLLRYGQQIQPIWLTKGEAIGRELGFDHAPLPGSLSDFDGVFVPLARVVKRQENPFAHENALLALAVTTLDFLDRQDDTRQFAPHQLEIKCEDWGKLNKAKKSVQRLELNWSKDAPSDSRYEPPVSWLTDDEVSPVMYRFGAFLRACVTGNVDFTVGQHLMREDTSHAYFGLKSSWYKRRMGMAHQPEAMNGEAAPMSSWVSELLYRLLQWPGLDIRTYADEWPEKLTMSGLRKLLVDRLEKQQKIYGKSSKLPVYIERIQHEAKDDKHLRVVMVQSLLPRREDFMSQGPQLNEPEYRARHRGHVATMARLVCDKFVAMKQAEGVKTIKPLADLIVFPELSVHEDDIGILKRLADKTGAMIFTGLVYRLQRGELINTALWLIPFKNGHGRQWIMRYQGKQHMAAGEKTLGINPWRPYQLVIELAYTLKGQDHGFRLSGAICYDATDISLAADMKDVTNTFIVSALNQDIDTFDTMVDALHYHMYQPVVLVNTGQFGGSAAKAPCKEKYHKQIAHVHGNNQIAISIFELNMYDFGTELPLFGSRKEKKTKPAGLKRVD
jgi:hypothetical protein